MTGLLPYCRQILAAAIQGTLSVWLSNLALVTFCVPHSEWCLQRDASHSLKTNLLDQFFPTCAPRATDEATALFQGLREFA